LKEIKVSKALVFFIVIAVLWAGSYMLIPVYFSAIPPNPHAKAFEGKCTSCHEDEPESLNDAEEKKEEAEESKGKDKKDEKKYRVSLFKKDIVSLCTDCHK